MLAVKNKEGEQFCCENVLVNTTEAKNIAELLTHSNHLRRVQLTNVLIDFKSMSLILAAICRNTRIHSLELTFTKQFIQENWCDFLHKFFYMGPHRDYFPALVHALNVHKTLHALTIVQPEFNAHELKSIAQILLAETPLQSLKLGRLHLGAYDYDLGIHVLASSLRTSTLQSFECVNVHLNYFSIYALATALSVNTSLKVIKLIAAGIEDDGVCWIKGVLQKNRSITVLDLSNNSISHEGANALGLALQKNRTLRELNLNNNRLTVIKPWSLSKIKTFAQGLQRNSSLVSLELAGNGLNHLSIMPLIWALAENTSLVRLNLSNNRISTGVNFIANVMNTNSSLKVLNLANNSIGTASMVNLSFALHNNCTLKVLNLTGNSMRRYGYQMLAKSLRINTTLLRLAIDYNSMNSLWKLHINSALERNRRHSSFIRSSHGLRNCILYSLFSKPQSVPNGTRFLPELVKLQLTKYLLSDVLYSMACCRRALAAGWCFSSVEEAFQFSNEIDAPGQMSAY
jgi:Ran GTPase-activating protein (RanGAP) involved in mRNA processing and transport